MIVIPVALGAAVAGLLGYAASRPDTFRMERRTTVAAPPEAILAHINDFRRWADWSPYDKLDPEMKKTYGGAPSGPGATYAWEGNGKAGAGQMTLLESTPTRTTIDLAFTRPFKARNRTEFTLEPRGASTDVTWSMQGPQPFINKLIGVLINMDKLVGKDFDAGLASLKALAERQAPAAR